MKHKFLLSILVTVIASMALLATTKGIFSDEGQGAYVYRSIRGQDVTIYGKGLYKHMSGEVAPQGIAQDYVTLFAGIPLLIISFILTRKGSLTGKYLLAGTLGYFLVTYLFYTVMGMYNSMFLAYVILMGGSFYAFLLVLFSFDTKKLQKLFRPSTPVKATGGFLIFNALTIALLWLSIVVPPLLDGSIIPIQVEHYTTLVVQGLDLGILLPAAFISGVLWLKKKDMGYLLAPVYYIFLSLLMTALSAKVVAMALLRYNVVPVIFIIPTFNLITIAGTVIILKHIDVQKAGSKKIHHESATYA